MSKDKWDVSRKDDFNRASRAQDQPNKPENPVKFKDGDHDALGKGPTPPGGHPRPAPSPATARKSGVQLTAQKKMEQARKDAQKKSLSKTFNGKSR